jgi:predicted ABC-type sugar transport system permease subunit
MDPAVEGGSDEVAQGRAVEAALTVPRRFGQPTLRSLGERYSLIVAFAIMLVVFAVIEPAKFYTHANIDIILGSQSVLMIAVLGQVISLSSGEFDISLAYVLGFANQVSAVLSGEHHWAAGLVIVATLGVGLFFGLVNAVLTVVFGIPSIVVTCAPSAWTARTVHDLTDSPSRRTVQAPHEVVSQPMFVPVRPRTSRRYCTSKSRGGTSCSEVVPFTVIVTRIVTP